MYSSEENNYFSKCCNNSEYGKYAVDPFMIFATLQSSLIRVHTRLLHSKSFHEQNPHFIRMDKNFVSLIKVLTI